jgi:transcriptional regulator with XRE-family HTH domain
VSGNVIPNDDGSLTIRITKLRKAILETKKPQYVIAASSGIHPSTLSKYVLGQKDVKVDHLAALSQTLNLPPETLIGWVSYTVDRDGAVVRGTELQ